MYCLCDTFYTRHVRLAIPTGENTAVQVWSAKELPAPNLGSTSPTTETLSSFCAAHFISMPTTPETVATQLWRRLSDRELPFRRRVRTFKQQLCDAYQRQILSRCPLFQLYSFPIRALLYPPSTFEIIR